MDNSDITVVGDKEYISIYVNPSGEIEIGLSAEFKERIKAIEAQLNKKNTNFICKPN